MDRYGSNPQFIADKQIHYQYFDKDALQALFNAGAHINADVVIDSMFQDTGYLLDKFQDETDIPFLKQIGASPRSMHKLQKFLYENTLSETGYSGPYPEKLDIVEDGKQTTKIFYIPHILVAKQGADRKWLKAEWASRVLPGQTLTEAIAADLEEVYGYSGNFKYRDIRFIDIEKDKKGVEIQWYSIQIALYPNDNDTSFD